MSAHSENRNITCDFLLYRMLSWKICFCTRAGLAFHSSSQAVIRIYFKKIVLLKRDSPPFDLLQMTLYFGHSLLIHNYRAGSNLSFHWVGNDRLYYCWNHQRPEWSRWEDQSGTEQRGKIGDHELDQIPQWAQTPRNNLSHIIMTSLSNLRCFWTNFISLTRFSCLALFRAITMLTYLVDFSNTKLEDFQKCTRLG